MRQVKFLVAAVMTACMFGPATAVPARASDAPVARPVTLTVAVTGVKAKGGAVLVALYARDPLYRDPAAIGEATDVAAGTIEVVVPNVPPGDYVVSAFHDANGNGRLDMAEGRLTEGTAISNADKLRGAPTFAVNRVAVSATANRVAVAMSYPEDRSGW